MGVIALDPKTLTAKELAVLSLLRRKPALVDFFLAVGEMVLYRRNHGVYLDCREGVLRSHNVTPVTRFPLEEEQLRQP